MSSYFAQIFSDMPTPTVLSTYTMSRRELRADKMLVENIRALLAARNLDDSALAIWCGHKPPWISKILSGERGIPTKELGKVADFFGLTVSQLFQHGISPLLDRRHEQRRKSERRVGGERRLDDSRTYGWIHPDAEPAFRAKRKLPT